MTFISDQFLLNSGTAYTYRVKAFQNELFSNYSNEATDTTFEITGFGQKDEVISGIPEIFALGQNYPNPFNPSTFIQYQLPKACRVLLTVYNIKGQKVAALVDKIQSAGYYRVEWHPDGLPSGIYVYKLKANGYINSNKMTFLK